MEALKKRARQIGGTEEFLKLVTGYDDILALGGKLESGGEAPG